MQALDHAAVAAGEFEQSAGERPGDAQRIGHRSGTKPEQMPGGDRGTKRAGGARCVKAACLVGVTCRAPDADHDLVAGDKGRDQRPAMGAALLGHRESGRQYGGAGMSPGTRARQAVELEGVGERPVG